MEINIGEKIVSDDYSAIGVLTEINNKLFVVSDNNKIIEYDEYNSDWEKYDIWKERICKKYWFIKKDNCNN